MAGAGKFYQPGPAVIGRRSSRHNIAYYNAMPVVRLDKVFLSFGLKPLLDNVSLQLRKRERVCLLGRNGEGKSSLLQLITRQL